MGLAVASVQEGAPATAQVAAAQGPLSSRSTEEVVPVAVTSLSGPPPRLVRHIPSSAVVITDLSCSALEGADQQSLGVTYWFDAEPTGDRYTMTVHLRGRLKQGSGEEASSAKPEGRTEFAVTSSLENVVPGSGRIALTTRIQDVAAGEWEVVATPVRPAPTGGPAPWVEAPGPGLSRGSASGRTALAPFVRSLAPGVRLGAWPALVGTGFVLALILQVLLARQFDIPGLGLAGLTVVASTLGLAGAKVYYLLTHPREPRSFLTPGLSVQGFVIATVGALVAGTSLLDLPLGAVLDVTAPGLLVAMAVGRLGCLLGGCCAGRPTSSRWGVWSSDRRVGVRRIPVQLLESALSAALGVIALVLVLRSPAAGSGLVLVLAVAAYVLGRQTLFPLRSIPRATRHGRHVTLVAAAAVLAGSATALVLG
ncbi:prolipoprotein diacylglyceryl transferase [Georgenia muralis]